MTPSVDKKYKLNGITIKTAKGKKVQVKKEKGVYTFSVADKKIATVNRKGMIKAKKQGATNVVVKVTYKNGMTKTLNEKVTVK